MGGDPSGTLIVAAVVSVPDSKHVQVTINGVNTTVPRLQHYTPVVGDACYLFVSPSLTVALGAVR
jgi:hypothetical protein